MPLPSPADSDADVWRKEAERLAIVYGTAMLHNDTDGAELAALLAHLAAVPLAQPEQQDSDKSYPLVPVGTGLPPALSGQWQKRHHGCYSGWGDWMNCTEENAKRLRGLRSWETRFLRAEPIAGPSSAPLLKDKKDSESMTSSPPSAPLIAQPAQEPLTWMDQPPEVVEAAHRALLCGLAAEFIESVHQGEWSSKTDRDTLVAALRAAPAPSQREVLDAARYRWLKANSLQTCRDDKDLGTFVNLSFMRPDFDSLDEAIDAAMSAGKTGEQS